MHLQQTKQGSAKSGGPQYYFHNLEDHVRIYLRTQGLVRVALMTPYGATKSDFSRSGEITNLIEAKRVYFMQDRAV